MPELKAAAAAEPTPPFIDYRNTDDGKIWASLGIPVCKKCGSKRITEAGDKLRCPNNLPDCDFIK